MRSGVHHGEQPHALVELEWGSRMEVLLEPTYLIELLNGSPMHHHDISMLELHRERRLLFTYIAATRVRRGTPDQVIVFWLESHSRWTAKR